MWCCYLVEGEHVNIYQNIRKVERLSLAEQAQVRLKEALLNGEFDPNERLIEERLAEAFKISRTPLRQALQQLGEQGLLEKHHSGGYKPVNLTLQDVMDAVEMRAFLESLLAKRAAANATDAEIMQISAYSNLFNSAKTNKNLQRLIELNTQLHLAVRQSARSPLLSKVLNELDSRTEKVVRYYIDVTTIDVWTITDHTEIIEYISNRDGDKAMESMREHVLFAGNLAIEHMRKHL